MNVFLTGISGLFGLNFALQNRNKFTINGSFNQHPIKIDHVNAFQLDLSFKEATWETVSDLKPDLILHAAALTNIDQCEKDPDLAEIMNVQISMNLAEIALDLQIPFVHISTDHLTAGVKSWVYEFDELSPLNTYAFTKMRAEQEVIKTYPKSLIVRTNFFGWGTSNRASFSDWILKGLHDRKELTMFRDVYFTPILVNHLIDLIMRLVENGASGVFNIAGGERLSKYDFALEIAQIFEISCDNVLPTSVDSYSFDAHRPKDMSLVCTKAESTLGIRMPSIESGLTDLKSLLESGWNQKLERSLYL